MMRLLAYLEFWLLAVMLGQCNTPDYSTAYTYDLNGNITSLRRNGLVSRELADTYELWTFGEIDNVEMTYNGNQFSRIDDADEDIVLSSSMDIIETPLQTAYDRNGNLSYFSKRGISRVRYNSLNLPESYLLGNERVRIVYDATGRKLSEIYELLPQSIASSISEMETEETAESQTNDSLWVQISRRDYCGNYIYQNGNISMITTPAGYISGSMRYYYLKDYQGNNCVVLNQNGVVQQINHYYPYGSLMGEGFNASSQPYRYGGKELVTLGGLNLSDFGARWLDSPSGTFTTMDPLCEDFQHLSPYLYCAGNPIKYIDPSGEAAIKVALSGLKYIKNLYKVYKKTGKLTKDNLKKAGLDEFIDIAGDIQTIFDGDASFLDKAAAVADIVVGTEFNDKGQKQAVEALGITSKKTFDEVLEGTIKEAKTSGRSKIYNKSGGLQKATEDFDALSLKDVSEIQTKYGKGKVGKNDKGETIVLRPGSSDGRPTLELQRGKNKIKIRYGE